MSLRTGLASELSAPEAAPAARVGIIDCTDAVMGAVCRELGSGGVPSAGFPHYVLLPAAPERAQPGAMGVGGDEWGAAAAKEASQTARLRRALVVFDPGSLPAHLALPVMGATLRALAPAPSAPAENEAASLAVARQKAEDAGQDAYRDEERPPPPAPQGRPAGGYTSPRPRPGFAVGGGHRPKSALAVDGK